MSLRATLSSARVIALSLAIAASSLVGASALNLGAGAQSVPVQITVNCAGSPETTTVRNATAGTIYVQSIGSLTDQRAGEPYSTNGQPISAGQSFTWQSGRGASGTVLTGSNIYDNDDPRDGALVNTSVGTFTQTCGGVTGGPTSVPATATPVRATSTPVRATATPIQATATPIRSTSTPVRATATPIRATATPVRATSTPVRATVTPVRATATPVRVTTTPQGTPTRPPRTTPGATATVRATATTASSQTATARATATRAATAPATRAPRTTPTPRTTVAPPVSTATPRSATATVSTGGTDLGNDGIDTNCSDFVDQAQAQQYFTSDGGSVDRNVDGLDPDRDGIACEVVT